MKTTNFDKWVQEKKIDLETLQVKNIPLYALRKSYTSPKGEDSTLIKYLERVKGISKMSYKQVMATFNMRANLHPVIEAFSLYDKRFSIDIEDKIDEHIIDVLSNDPLQFIRLHSYEKAKNILKPCFLQNISLTQYAELNIPYQDIPRAYIFKKIKKRLSEYNVDIFIIKNEDAFFLWNSATEAEKELLYNCPLLINAIADEVALPDKAIETLGKTFCEIPFKTGKYDHFFWRSNEPKPCKKLVVWAFKHAFIEKLNFEKYPEFYEYFTEKELLIVFGRDVFLQFATADLLKYCPSILEKHPRSWELIKRTKISWTKMTMQQRETVVERLSIERLKLNFAYYSDKEREECEKVFASYAALLPQIRNYVENPVQIFIDNNLVPLFCYPEDFNYEQRVFLAMNFLNCFVPFDDFGFPDWEYGNWAISLSQEDFLAMTAEQQKAFLLKNLGVWVMHKGKKPMDKQSFQITEKKFEFDLIKDYVEELCEAQAFGLVSQHLQDCRLLPCKLRMKLFEKAAGVLVKLGGFVYNWEELCNTEFTDYGFLSEYIQHEYNSENTVISKLISQFKPNVNKMPHRIFLAYLRIKEPKCEVFSELYRSTYKYNSWAELWVNKEKYYLIVRENALYIRTESETIHTFEWVGTPRGRYIERLVIDYFSLKPVKVEKRLKRVQMYEYYELKLLRKIGQVEIYERSFCGLMVDVCALRNGREYHAQTIAEAIEGIRHKDNVQSVAKSRQKQKKDEQFWGQIFDMESAHKEFGFCYLGMKDFCREINIDPNASYSRAMIKEAVISTGIKTVYKPYLTKMGIKL